MSPRKPNIKEKSKDTCVRTFSKLSLSNINIKRVYAHKNAAHAFLILTVRTLQL